MSRTILDALAQVVAGDVASLTALAQVPHATIEAASEALPEVTLTRQAVRSVLAGLRSGQVSRPQAQAWASFMRWGILVQAPGPYRAISIDLEAGSDEPMTAILGRLDELGDAVDGEIDDSELVAMIADLS